MRKKQIKKVQGTYITEEALAVIQREAEKEGIKTTTLASEILEKEAKNLLRKEKKIANIQEEDQD